MALHLHQFQGAHTLRHGERVLWCLRKKLLYRLRAAVEHNMDVAVARRPHILEDLAALLLGERDQCVAQLVQSLAQRRAPGLVPARPAAVAAAIGAPPLNAMHAAPGGVFDDLSLVLGRELLQEIAVVGQLDGGVFFQQAQCVGQRHLPVFVVVAVRLAVRGHVHQLRTEL